MTSAAAAGTTAGIPCDGIPQIAMAGRSNVGKSSLINALSRAKIARTSAAPGKTRLANIYRLTLDGGPGKWGLYLVDLPGYGYARGGADAAAELRAVAEGYFAGRESRFAVRLSRLGVGGARNARRGLEAAGRANSEPQTANRGVRAALLLVDSRHPGLESDLQAARWLQSMNIEHRVVATKVDKLSRTERARSRQALENSFGMPPLAVSATSGEGLDTLWKTIASLVRAGHE